MQDIVSKSDLFPGDVVARYYLNQRCGPDVISDWEGAEFRDLDAAKLEVVASIREMIRESVRSGYIEMSWRFEISDAAGAVLMSVAFQDTLDFRN